MADMTVGLMPEFSEIVKEFVLQANFQGYKVDVFSGYRSIEEQAKLYAQGRTAPGTIVTNAQPGHSFHNWGLAVDVVFKDANDHFTWNVSDDQWHQLAAVGNSLGLEPGAYWKTFTDKPHFQLTGGLTIAEAQAIGVIEDVWAEVNKRLEVA